MDDYVEGFVWLGQYDIFIDMGHSAPDSSLGSEDLKRRVSTAVTIPQIRRIDFPTSGGHSSPLLFILV